ncbi:hypothetical protein [Leptospira wolffii]|uniref:hypothetical protein n=1 Tax=Leptospira wolffii TaxID=409998 RepID=UPI0013FD1A9E|nr:hypothetical protein [Leptospira wolffii]
MRYSIITILLFSFTLFAEEPKADVTQSESGIYAHTSFRSLNGEFLHLNGSILDASNRGILVDTAYVIPGHEAWDGKEAFARTLKLLENIKRD